MSDNWAEDARSKYAGKNDVNKGKVPLSPWRYPKEKAGKPSGRSIDNTDIMQPRQPPENG